MICYRDTTWCHFHRQCADGDTCPRALTNEIKRAAYEWWGSEEAPIATFLYIPDCFKAIVDSGVLPHDEQKDE